MFRKKLTPSCIRRCAVFLAIGGALALNGGYAREARRWKAHRMIRRAY